MEKSRSGAVDGEDQVSSYRWRSPGQELLMERSGSGAIDGEVQVSSYRWRGPGQKL